MIKENRNFILKEANFNLLRSRYNTLARILYPLIDKSASKRKSLEAT